MRWEPRGGLFKEACAEDFTRVVDEGKGVAPHPGRFGTARVSKHPPNVQRHRDESLRGCGRRPGDFTLWSHLDGLPATKECAQASVVFFTSDLHAKIVLRTRDDPSLDRSAFGTL